MGQRGGGGGQAGARTPWTGFAQIAGGEGGFQRPYFFLICLKKMRLCLQYFSLLFCFLTSVSFLGFCLCH